MGKSKEETTKKTLAVINRKLRRKMNTSETNRTQRSVDQNRDGSARMKNAKFNSGTSGQKGSLGTKKYTAGSKTRRKIIPHNMRPMKTPTKFQNFGWAAMNLLNAHNIMGGK